MKSIAVRKMLTNKIKKITRNYTNLLEQFEQEEIHNFRLEIKKLKALIRLVECIDGQDNRLKIGRQMRIFYRTTGAIRNLQLYQSKVVHLCKDLGIEVPFLYLKNIEEEDIRLKKLARQEATNFSFNEFEKKIIRATPKKLKETAVQNFVQQKMEQVLTLLFMPVYTDECLHQTRKVLKDILYVWPIICACETLSLPDLFTNKKFLESFTVKLGDYQDSCITLRFFEPSCMKGIIVAKEMHDLKILKHYFVCTKQMLKDEIEMILMTLLQALKTSNQLLQKEELV